MSQLQLTPLFPYRKTNPTKFILEMLTKLHTGAMGHERGLPPSPFTMYGQ